VVVTLPERLSSLALGNREEVYNLLYAASWEVLKAKIEKDVGIQAAGAGVLHTWNQRLGHHPYIHFVVPGNGPSIDGTKWIDCRMTKGTRSDPPKPFLVDNKVLGREFRDLFLKRLAKKIEQGKIVPQDSAQIASVIKELSVIDWAVYIQGPPKRECGGELVLKYLTRYMTGGPISNKRIIEEKDGRISYRVRKKDKSGGRERFSLPGATFLQQWCLHILPKEFTRSRATKVARIVLWLSPSLVVRVDESGETPSKLTESKQQESIRNSITCPNGKLGLSRVNRTSQP